MIQTICSSLVAPLVALLSLSAIAQSTYPTKPIRILVGFVPGGFTDTSARIVGQKLAEAIGQQVIVENRPGANGLIAGDLTSRAAPDGYTIFMTSPGLTTNPSLYDKLKRDPVNDFTAISFVAAIPNLLVPRMWREIFPKILAQLEGAGVLTITVTDTEITVVPCIGGAEPDAALGLDPGAA